MVQTAASEMVLKGTNVRVNAVAPGIVQRSGLAVSRETAAGTYSGDATCEPVILGNGPRTDYRVN